MPDSDEDEGGKGSTRTKSRRELPAGAVATLKAWLLSPEHFTHPYPTPQDQVMLMQKTGIDKKQLKNWFTNARRRIWKPMLKKQLEQGKLSATAGGGVAVPGVVQPMMVPQMQGGVPGQADQMYQQPMQQQAMSQQEVAVDQYGNPIYSQRTVAHAAPPAPVSAQQQYYEPAASAPMPSSTSIGSLPPMGHSGSGQQLSKTDSHAVLMELFARDQDLVRQATESAGLKPKSPSHQDSQQQGQATIAQSPISSQHPMKVPSQSRLVNVPTLNSWPHFSSVSSLNNLGTMPGVKSITSLSGADLAKQGPVNSADNLAKVKSVESMGKNDSYAFLEVFFGDRSSTALSSMVGSKEQRGIKRERDEDNDVGLSLEDESPSTSNLKQEDSAPNTSLKPSFMGDKGGKDSTGTLKRAYDDALAARGLISVSRSCEKLTDLALPAKIQRTLSQEFLRQQQQQQQAQAETSWYSSTAEPSQDNSPTASSSAGSQQYPGQHPGQHQQHQSDKQPNQSSFSSGTSSNNASVEVPSATKCALCGETGVDTQLRPCGHMFHERCLKPSLQSPMGPPKCPVDHIPIQSALLAVPTDENTKPQQQLVAPLQPQPASWRASPVAAGQALSTSDLQR